MDTPESTPALHLEICALDRAPYKTEVTMVSLPGADGVFTVLPGHAPIMSTLGIGTLNTVSADGGKRYFAINGGVAQVLHNQVLVLTETVEADSDIDLDRAQSARKRAEDRMRSLENNTDRIRCEAAIKRAVARIRAHTQSAQQSARNA